MGAGSSSSATPILNDKAGLIDVGDAKKKVTQAIDLLFQQLLTATNPINFRQAMEATGGTAQTCSGILVLLAPTIEQEFQKLALEDPETKNIVKSIFKGYDSVDDFSSTILTRTLCKEITLFFLRLIILVGTCVISIRPNKAMTGLLGTLGTSMIEQSKDFEGIVKIKMVDLAVPIADPAVKDVERKSDTVPLKRRDIFAKLPEDQKDRDLKVTIKRVLQTDKTVVKKVAGEYYVVRYNSQEYVIDLYNLFVYRNESDTAKKVGVISLTGSFNDPPEKKEEKKTRRNQMQGGRRTRRAQRGGEDPKEEIEIRSSGGEQIKISTAKAEQHGAKDQYYYMFNRTDDSCSNAKPVRAACPPSDEKRISTNMTASEFVEQVIIYYLSVFNGNAYSKEQIDKNGASIEPVSGTGAKVTGYSPLTIGDKGTYARLQNLLEIGEVGKLQEGTCLAVYRAYLLASGLTQSASGESQLKTYICHDKWADEKTPLPKLPLFALLEQLYKDRLGTEMESTTAEKYNTFISKLSNIGTVELIDQNVIKQTFSGLRFKQIAKDTPVCKKGLSGFETVTHSSTIDIVMTQYKSIAEQLVKLIDNISIVLNKIIDFPLFIKENRIKLRPIFVENKDGAQAVLTRFIEEVRTLLEDHILSVEQSYMTGVAIVANNEDTLLTEAPSLEDPSTKGLVD